MIGLSPLHPHIVVPSLVANLQSISLIGPTSLMKPLLQIWAFHSKRRRINIESIKPGFPRKLFKHFIL